MIIVYIIDSYGEFSNGTTMTAVRSKQKLEEMGHEVRVVSVSNIEGKEYYQLKQRYIPIVTPVSKKQNTYFAKPDKKVLRKAFEGADVVHFFFPWKSAQVAIKVAKEMGIAVTGSYHMCPEHVAYGSGMGKFFSPVTWFLYKYFKHRVYKVIDRVHCPSPVMANRLKEQRYKNILHPITNGVGKQFFIDVDRPDNPEVFQILIIGRLSLEKRQEVLLKAIKHSKYKEKIKLVIAGQGPKEKKLKLMAKRYKLNVEFGFYKQKDLIKKIAESDLYVHTAEVETEGISVLEALAGGLVPVLANTPFSAPGQIFALDERSLFKLNKHKDLAKKIEYWIENPAERQKMSKEYQKFMQNFNIDTAVKRLYEMFVAAVHDEKIRLIEKRDSVKGYVKKLRPNKFKMAIVKTLYFIFMPVAIGFWYVFKGLRINGRKNIKEIRTGGIIISNHVHDYDSMMNACATYPRLAVYTAIPENLEHDSYGNFVRLFGTIPIPRNIEETKVFVSECTTKVKNGDLVFIYPEGNLLYKYNNLQPFKKGAFHIAHNAMVPIVPTRINFVKKKKKNGKYKKRIILNVGKPIYPSYYMLKRDSIDDLLNMSYRAMEILKESSE
ncbi:MAG: glycosyltransferase [Erysipelotrichaceae bacterium]|nr:glycosyltransferase [Erysipelotrichaceae bacterium]